jgi:hypothetical protein
MWASASKFNLVSELVTISGYYYLVDSVGEILEHRFILTVGLGAVIPCHVPYLISSIHIWNVGFVSHNIPKKYRSYEHLRQIGHSHADGG